MKTAKNQIRRKVALSALLLSSTMLAGMAHAQAAGGSTVEELVVTAQKREENIQDVPVAVTAFTTRKLEELGIASFDDYVKFLPSVASQSSSPGFSNVYMRGVASGGDGNHSGSLPSVGTYLDDAPVTSIGGALDVHLYDIARVEALAGPQGTLYGASSQAGTLRIITNQPEVGVVKGRFDVGVNNVAHGGTGYVAEGMVNVPMSDQMAIRLVAWDVHDAGYIDNVAASRTYPVSGVTRRTQPQKNFNETDTYGARISMRLDLNDTWTVRPSIMAQDQKADGAFSYDPRLGDLKVERYLPEDSHDRWHQAALAVEGKISNLDVIYTGSYNSRTIDSRSDYTDYSYFYDTLYGSGNYITDASGAIIDPTQSIVGFDKFTRASHEIRLSSPQDWRFRFVVGAFAQRQTHFILQDYRIANFDPALSITGHPGTLWLTEQFRVDRDTAAFGEAYFDITPKLMLTAGVRAFKSDNSLKGFFGLSAAVSSRTGEVTCFAPVSVGQGPCTNVDKRVEETGQIYKLNLTYRIDDDKMVYATYSQGFRPGGINRRGTRAPYSSDYLYNHELGWKTQWADNTLRFNGAIYLQDWKDFQFSFLGPNSFTEILNAGQARIKGAETDISWRPMDGLTIGVAATYTDAKLTQDYCGTTNPATGKPLTVCATPQAPNGTELPITPKFKANSTVRYEFPWGDYNAHIQGAVVYQGASWADLRLQERADLGRMRAYAQADLSLGLARDSWKAELAIENVFDKRGDLYRSVKCPSCAAQPYIRPTDPRTISLSFGRSF